MCVGLVVWTSSFAEDGVHRGLVEGLELGLRDWDSRRIDGIDGATYQ